MIAPKIEELSKEYKDIQFLKIDVDKMGEISQQYGIQAMPTFVFIKNEKEVSRTQGADINGIINQITALTATIETVEQYKQKGNNAYSNDKNYNEALKNYQLGLKTLQSLTDYMSKYKELYIKFHTNIALMYLKIGGDENSNNCIRHCNEVLRKEIDQFNQKAYLRKGEAFMNMNNYKSAKAVYGQYMKYDPDNQEMKAKWSEAKQKLKQQKQQSNENKL